MQPSARSYFSLLKNAIINENGREVVKVLYLDKNAPCSILYSSNSKTASNTSSIDSVIQIEFKLLPQWIDFIKSFALFCTKFNIDSLLAKPNISDENTLVSSLIQLSSKLNRWSLPILYYFCSHLKDSIVSTPTQQQDEIENSARIINRAFSLCINDRSSSLDASRKWGTYYLANLKQYNLCNNVIKAIKASIDLPPLDCFPLIDQVQFRYYSGRLDFMSENYDKADGDLSFALKYCLIFKAVSNIKQILQYLIPLKAFRGGKFISFSTDEVNKKCFCGLELYQNLMSELKDGNIKQYNSVLDLNQQYLLKKGTFLLFEKLTFIAYRNLFKKIYLILEKRSRISYSEFQIGLAFCGIDIVEDEIECILANLIYKNFIKGYLSHEKKIVVLSQKDPFPQISTAYEIIA